MAGPHGNMSANAVCTTSILNANSYHVEQSLYRSHLQSLFIESEICVPKAEDDDTKDHIASIPPANSRTNRGSEQVLYLFQTSLPGKLTMLIALERETTPERRIFHAVPVDL